MKKVIALHLITLLAILGSCSTETSPICPYSNCDNYTTQEQAQAAFDANPECLKNLDADNDRKACEHLRSEGGSTSCPDTANCGCSGKTKSECGGPCCQWIVGTGCKCN
ncbi:hypothetical protein [Fulvivirga sediminis]|uniref:Excalibur calcium-binding domain-containing protein n=1 Tax=Fulvivirga sediminis TaxID=2803949 RepID=A0A937K079_9BACT|nr:hypothetical protein [Fulvivirga sediminis]MBL3657384.1 hypothetical protein [Fulvivirga sediminis]